MRFNFSIYKLKCSGVGPRRHSKSSREILFKKGERFIILVKLETVCKSISQRGSSNHRAGILLSVYWLNDLPRTAAPWVLWESHSWSAVWDTSRQSEGCPSTIHYYAFGLSLGITTQCCFFFNHISVICVRLRKNKQACKQ